MQLDAATLLVASCATLIFVGCALLYFWHRDRRSTWLLWWAFPWLFGGLTALLYVRPGWQTDFLAIGVGNALRIAAVSMLWHGARLFEGRRPLLLPAAIVVLVWPLACLYPPFLHSMPARVVLVSFAIGTFCVLTAWELWRGRREVLPSRLAAVVVLLSFSLVMATRIVGFAALPFPMGGLPPDTTWLAAFNLIVFVHASFLGLLLIAMTKERQELKQRQIALVDPLTGLMNRRAFMGDAERQSRRPGEGRRPTALLVLDLDHFKSVNDRFGHEVGDRVLARFAAIAESAVRPTDRLYRMGGEEFCFVLPDTVLKDAIAVAERVRKAFADGVVDGAGGERISATLSVGIAATEFAGFDLEVLLAAADTALYEAKARGRNRVVVADPAELGHSPEPVIAPLRFSA